MSQNRLEDSLKVLKLNTELYPKAANTWDSYGEILLKLSKEKEAVNAYKKSLKLDQIQFYPSLNHAILT